MTWGRVRNVPLFDMSFGKSWPRNCNQQSSLDVLTSHLKGCDQGILVRVVDALKDPADLILLYGYLHRGKGQPFRMRQKWNALPHQVRLKLCAPPFIDNCGCYADKQNESKALLVSFI